MQVAPALQKAEKLRKRYWLYIWIMTFSIIPMFIFNSLTILLYPFIYSILPYVLFNKFKRKARTIVNPVILSYKNIDYTYKDTLLKEYNNKKAKVHNHIKGNYKDIKFEMGDILKRDFNGDLVSNPLIVIEYKENIAQKIADKISKKYANCYEIGFQNPDMDFMIEEVNNTQNKLYIQTIITAPFQANIFPVPFWRNCTKIKFTKRTLKQLNEIFKIIDLALDMK
jgi:hypothetical protein